MQYHSSRQSLVDRSDRRALFVDTDLLSIWVCCRRCAMLAIHAPVRTYIMRQVGVVLCVTLALALLSTLRVATSLPATDSSRGSDSGIKTSGPNKERSTRFPVYGAAAGKIRWKATMRKGTPSQVSVSPQGYVFVNAGGDTGGPAISLLAYRAQNGRAVWQKVISREDGLPTTPAVDKSGDVFVTTDEGVVSAYVGATGVPLWSFTDGELDDTSVDASSPALIERSLYAAFSGRGIYALSKSNGAKIWRNEALTTGRAAPAVCANDRLAAFERDDLVMLDATNGTILWRKRIGIGGPLFCHDGRVYMASCGRVYCWDSNTGKPAWTSKRIGEGLLKLDSADGLILVADTGFANDVRLIALDAKSGRMEWTYVLRNAAGVTPVIGPKGAIYAFNAPDLVAIDIRTRKLRWKLDLKIDDTLFSSTISGDIDGSIYVANGKTGYLYAID